MTIRRFATFSFFIAAAGCAPAAQNARNQLAPKDGPKVTLNASYSGGLFDRNVYSYFSVDRPSYVMIAHLSGEGVIEVLYPVSARDTAQTPAGKSLRTQTFFAPYDGVPMLYAMRGVTPIRDLSARINSYDGLGHAYIFAIASDEPLNFDALSESGLWNDVDVPNYMWNPDPRRSIRDFADAIAGDTPYTLRFADSYRTTTFTSYADAAWTCSMLATLSLTALHSLGYYHGGSSWYCPGAAYSLFDSYFFGARQYDRRYVPTFAFVPTPPQTLPRRSDAPSTEPKRKPVPASASLHLLPSQTRVRLVGDAEEEFNRPSRAELSQGQRTLVAPRRAAADAETPGLNPFDQRRTTYGSARRFDDPARWDHGQSAATNPRVDRAERRSERAEQPARSPHAERPQVDRTDRPAPAPRAEPRSEQPRGGPPRAEPSDARAKPPGSR